MEYFGFSDIGLIREKNQDSFTCLLNEYNDFICVVCDGVGACKFSEQASELIVDTIKDRFNKNKKSLSNSKEIIEFLDNTLGELNYRIYDTSTFSKEYKFLSSTVAGLYLNTNNDKVVFNSGDSRVYGIKDKKVELLSKDDTLTNRLLEEGKITEDEAINHPNKNVITNACGIGKAYTINYKIIKNNYDYYIICSDGFYKYLDEYEIVKILYKNVSIQEKVKDLISISLLKGGDDNISVIVVKENV